MPGTSIEPGADGTSAAVVTPSGKRFRFLRGTRDWGFAGFLDDADDRQKRAVGDVEQVRLNAADFERAAARGAR